MCYNVSAKSNKKTLEARFKAKFQIAEEPEPLYQVSGFVHPKLPVILSESNELIKLSAWGLIPSWVKDEKQAAEMRAMTLNAKSETVFVLPSFKNSIRQKRCLVLVDGFYEWRTIKKNKYPHFIYLKNKEPFAFGGIYSDWVNKATGEIINTFSIITTKANPLMEKIHNTKMRMPLILPKETEKDWLNPDLNEKQITEMMQPFSESLMEAHTISKLITSRAENPNQSAVQEPFEYPELQGL